MHLLRERRITLGHVPLLVAHPADPSGLFDAIDPSALGAADSRAGPRSDPRSDPRSEPRSEPAAGADFDDRIPYWAEVWPAAVALGRHLVGLDLRGKRVIELGAGVGLAGLAAARAGATVLLTDYQEEALDIARRNAVRNGLDVSCARLDWRDDDWPRRCFDLAVAADVLYERRQVEPLARLIPELLAPGGRALIADPRRPYAAALIATLAACGLGVMTRPMHLFWDGRGRVIDLITVTGGPLAT